MSVDTEIPVLVSHLSADTVVCPRCSAASGHVTVISIDLAVAVAVHESILDRLALCIVKLLVHIVCIRSEALAVK